MVQNVPGLENQGTEQTHPSRLRNQQDLAAEEPWGGPANIRCDEGLFMAVPEDDGPGDPTTVSNYLELLWQSEDRGGPRHMPRFDQSIEAQF